MASRLYEVYLVFKRPRNFLRVLLVYIITSLTLHFAFGIDADLGGTNLVLSIEAAITTMVLIVASEESNAVQLQMLQALLTLAEGQRDSEVERLQLLREMREHDAQMLDKLERLGGTANATNNP